MSSATATKLNESASATIEVLKRTIKCIEKNHVDKASCLAIQDQMKKIMSNDGCYPYFPSPSRDDFMEALIDFMENDDINHLDLSLPTSPFPICLATDKAKDVSVVLLVTLRAPAWITSTGKDADASYFDSSRALKSTAYTVAGNTRSCGEARPHMKENGRIIGDILLQSVLPLGELYVLPTWVWESLRTQPPESFQLPSEARSNFFAVLHFRGEDRSSLADIWAIWNYHPDRVQNSLDNTLDINPWRRDDLLLTLLRDESALVSTMRGSGLLDTDPIYYDYHSYHFDFMPLLDIYDDTDQVSPLRTFASERGQMVHPVLKAEVPLDSDQSRASCEDSGQSDDEVEDGERAPTSTSGNSPQVSGHSASPRSSCPTSLHEDEEMDEECETDEAKVEDSESSDYLF